MLIARGPCVYKLSKQKKITNAVGNPHNHCIISPGTALLCMGPKRARYGRAVSKQAVFHYPLTLTLLLTQEAELLMLLKYLDFVQNHKMQALLTPDILIGKLGSCHSP